MSHSIFLSSKASSYWHNKSTNNGLNFYINKLLAMVKQKSKQNLMGIFNKWIPGIYQNNSITITSEALLFEHIVNLEQEKLNLLQLQQLQQELSLLIVHDLRNPLANLYTSLKMLEESNEQEGSIKITEETSTKLINLAILNCERIKHLTDDLLDIAKLESGEEKLNLSQTNLQTLLKTVVNRMEPSLNRKQLTIKTTLPAKLPNVLLDEKKIDRVLSNLLDNAIKYTPHGEKIEVNVTIVNANIKISVNDKGPGIPLKDHKRIFERFAQVNKLKSKRGGYGLGLLFCRLAIEKHKGQIWVESNNNGTGSKFIFTLPLK